MQGKTKETLEKTALEEVQELLKSPNIRNSAEKIKTLGLALITISRLIEEANKEVEN